MEVAANYVILKNIKFLNPEKSRKRKSAPGRPGTAGRAGAGAGAGHGDALSFVAYVLYPPLYIAGPTVAYDDYERSATAPQQDVSTWECVKLLARALLLRNGEGDAERAKDLLEALDMTWSNHKIEIRIALTKPAVNIPYQGFLSGMSAACQKDSL